MNNNESRQEQVYDRMTCSGCVFLGHYHTNDLWYCKGAQLIYVRWGNDHDQEHLVVPEEITHDDDPCFIEAKRIAVERGLIDV